MTSAVFGWAPVMLDMIGEEQADRAPARVTPPPAARNWRRDIPVIGAYFCSCPGLARAAVMWGTPPTLS